MSDSNVTITHQNDDERRAPRYVLGAPMLGVVRCTTEYGSHIEPPLDPAWSDFDRLRWLTAVVQYDAGLTLTVAHFLESDTYSIAGHGRSLGAVSYGQAWRTIVDLGTGAQMVNDLTARAAR